MSDPVPSQCFMAAMRNHRTPMVALTVPTRTQAAMRLFASILNTTAMQSLLVIPRFF